MIFYILYPMRYDTIATSFVGLGGMDWYIFYYYQRLLLLPTDPITSSFFQEVYANG